jgi:ribosome recycling factor
MSLPPETSTRLAQAVEHLRTELTGVRTGRATPALVEHLKVEQYGAMVELRTAAAITAPEPRLLVIQPWDPSLVPAIEKALQTSSLGFNPASDGHVLRVPIPALTAERRQELSKIVADQGERARVAIRAIREDLVKAIRREEKEGSRSEDDAKRALDELQAAVDAANDDVRKACDEKIHDIETL